MKTDKNNNIGRLPVLVFACLMGSHGAWALPPAPEATGSPGVIGPASEATDAKVPVGMPENPPASLPMPGASGASASDMPVLPPPTGGAIGGANPIVKANDDKGIDNFDVKTPDSVKDVVKRLDGATDNVTVDDLNSARQAVAKLEALIDIEKHINELEKVRKDRADKASSPSPIPASAIMPTGAVPAMPVFTPPPSPSSFDVLQVVGSAGHFSAIIKQSDGKMSTVHEGDHLSKNTLVRSISTKGVEIVQGKKKRFIAIKNVGPILGRTP